MNKIKNKYEINKIKNKNEINKIKNKNVKTKIKNSNLWKCIFKKFIVHISKKIWK